MNNNSQDVHGNQQHSLHEVAPNPPLREDGLPTTAEVMSAPPAPQRISEEDMLKWELAKLNKQLAISQAETALAKSDVADLHHRYTVLQIYMKYKLTDQDTINNGVIVFGGANKS